MGVRFSMPFAAQLDRSSEVFLRFTELAKCDLSHADVFEAGGDILLVISFFVRCIRCKEQRYSASRLAGQEIAGRQFVLGPRLVALSFQLRPLILSVRKQPAHKFNTHWVPPEGGVEGREEPV